MIDEINWFLTLDKFMSMFNKDKQTLLQDMYEIYPKEFLELQQALEFFKSKKVAAILR